MWWDDIDSLVTSEKMTVLLYNKELIGCVIEKHLREDWKASCLTAVGLNNADLCNNRNAIIVDILNLSFTIQKMIVPHIAFSVHLLTLNSSKRLRRPGL